MEGKGYVQCLKMLLDKYTFVVDLRACINGIPIQVQAFYLKDNPGPQTCDCVFEKLSEYGKKIVLIYWTFHAIEEKDPQPLGTWGNTHTVVTVKLQKLHSATYNDRTHLPLNAIRIGVIFWACNGDGVLLPISWFPHLPNVIVLW